MHSVSPAETCLLSWLQGTVTVCFVTSPTSALDFGQTRSDGPTRFRLVTLGETLVPDDVDGLIVAAQSESHHSRAPVSTSVTLSAEAVECS